MTPPATPPSCVCGHGKEAHEHFRPGTDCAFCAKDGCDHYRPATGVRAVLRRLFSR